MKSLRDTYSEAHGSTSETFADLMFCALIILVLFVMALAVEVSLRVRSDALPQITTRAPAETDAEAKTENKTETVAEMAENAEAAEPQSASPPAEAEALTKKLEAKAEQIAQLQAELEKSAEVVEQERKKVANQRAALSGEQRFTGAREPAFLNLGYDYHERRFYFLSVRDKARAETKMATETVEQYDRRKEQQMREIASRARRQRGFTYAEAVAIYQALSTYQQINPDGDSYTVEHVAVGITYNPWQSAYIAGDDTFTDREDEIIKQELTRVYENTGPGGGEMYPRLELEVDDARRRVRVNGVELRARDIREILLAIGGRGAVLDLEGLDGKAPEWLREQVLIPAGYISGLPKMPSE
jgi:hypothetical protein